MIAVNYNEIAFDRAAVPHIQFNKGGKNIEDDEPVAKRISPPHIHKQNPHCTSSYLRASSEPEFRVTFSTHIQCNRIENQKKRG